MAIEKIHQKDQVLANLFLLSEQNVMKMPSNI